jgi:two-component system OmpR family response regulator
MEKGNILLVEDDEHLGYLLSENLIAHHYNVKWRKDGKSGWETFEQDTFKLCLLDIIVPGIDGLELARRIRKAKPEVPIIFITARSLKSDVITGYELGCDDYIIKPFEVFHLMLKVKAVIARRAGHIADKVRFLEMGNLKLDIDRQRITIDDNEINISRIESQLLKFFLSSDGEVVTRNFLLETIWERNDIYTSKSLDTYLSRIRKHLKLADVQLENIYGVGYLLQLEEK